MRKKVEKNKYSDLIAKLQRRKKLLIVLYILAFVSYIIFGTTSQTTNADGVVVTRTGLHPILFVFFLLFLFFCCVLSYAAVISAPMLNAMNQECDPEKYLALAQALTRPTDPSVDYASAYLYLGAFPKAMEYADKMISKKNPPFVLVGLLHRTRCDFFMGDYDALKQDVERYESALASAKKIKPKTRLELEKILPSLRLLCALADDDTERIEKARNTTAPWNDFRTTEGYVNYIKGLAALRLDDKKEALYRLTAVTDRCPKTVFGRMAAEKLETL